MIDPCPRDLRDRILEELRWRSVMTWGLLLPGWSVVAGPLYWADQATLRSLPSDAEALLALLSFVGWLLCFGGSFSLARLRHRALAWGLFGGFGCLGSFALHLWLRRRCRHCGLLESSPALDCPACNAPL